MDYDIEFLERALFEAEMRGEFIKCTDDSHWEFIYYGRDVTMYFNDVKDCLAFVGREINRAKEERFTAWTEGV